MADEGKLVLFQVINITQQELLFGTTNEGLEKEIARLAKNPRGPTGHWKKGDLVHWRPLTDLVDARMARRLHKDFESKTPPNKFKVIPTYAE